MKNKNLILIGALGIATVFLLVAAVTDINSHFPGAITLSGTTNQITDDGSSLLRNGSAITGGGGAIVGTVVTNGGTPLAFGDIAAYQAGITNIGKATSGQITNAIGFRMVNAAGDTMVGPLLVTGLTNTALTASRVVISSSTKAETSTSAGSSSVVMGDGSTVLTNGLVGQIGAQPTNIALTTLAVSQTNGFLGQIGGTPTNSTVATNWFQVPNRMLVTGTDTRPTNSNSRFPMLIALAPNVVPPSGTAAYIDTASADTKLVFSNTWTATYQYRIPGNFFGNLAVVLTCNEETATSAACAFTAEVWALSPGDNASMGTQSFDTANVAFATTPGTARWPFDITFGCTNIDSMVAGDWFQLRLTCTTNTGLVNVESVQLGYDVQ